MSADEIRPQLDRGTIAGLQMTPLFRGLPPADLEKLLAGAWIEVHADGDVLFETGEAAERFFVMLSGHVELVLDEGGRRAVLEIAERAALLGEAAPLPGGRHPNAARVIGAATVLIVPAGPFPQRSTNAAWRS
jgi:CRP-like cAMP-binding protein